MTRIKLTQGDITQLQVDAVVNAANRRLAGGGGVDGAIHKAGGPSILEECQAWVSEHGELETGRAMSTGAGAMPAGHVIHTVGPVWTEHDEQTANELLAACYRNSLDLASELDCRSVAFPNISTGVYRFPKTLAAATAVETVRERGERKERLDEIIFVCFDEENHSIYAELLRS